MHLGLSAWATSGHAFAKLNLIERELRPGCLLFFSARRGAASVRYVQSLVFILEVLKHKQADHRGQIALFASAVDLSDQF